MRLALAVLLALPAAAASFEEHKLCLDLALGLDREAQWIELGVAWLRTGEEPDGETVEAAVLAAIFELEHAEIAAAQLLPPDMAAIFARDPSGGVLPEGASPHLTLRPLRGIVSSGRPLGEVAREFRESADRFRASTRAMAAACGAVAARG